MRFFAAVDAASCRHYAAADAFSLMPLLPYHSMMAAASQRCRRR